MSTGTDTGSGTWHVPADLLAAFHDGSIGPDRRRVGRGPPRVLRPLPARRRRPACLPARCRGPGRRRLGAHRRPRRSPLAAGSPGGAPGRSSPSARRPCGSPPSPPWCWSPWCPLAARQRLGAARHRRVRHHRPARPPRRRPRRVPARRRPGRRAQPRHAARHPSARAAAGARSSRRRPSRSGCSSRSSSRSARRCCSAGCCLGWPWPSWRCPSAAAPRSSVVVLALEPGLGRGGHHGPRGDATGQRHRRARGLGGQPARRCRSSAPSSPWSPRSPPSPNVTTPSWSGGTDEQRRRE